MSLSHTPTQPGSLAAMIVDRLEQLIREAEEQNKPLEVDPLRGRLFELFVTAEASGLVDEDSELDLTADGICQTLSQRWPEFHRESHRESEGNGHSPSS